MLAYQLVGLMAVAVFQVWIWRSAIWRVADRRTALESFKDRGDETPRSDEERRFPWLGKAARILAGGANPAYDTRAVLADDLDRELDQVGVARLLRALDDVLPKLILIATGVHLLLGVMVPGDAVTSALVGLLVTYLFLNLFNLLNGYFVDDLSSQEEGCRGEALAWFDDVWKEVQAGPVESTEAGRINQLIALVNGLRQHQKQAERQVEVQAEAARRQAEASEALTRQVEDLTQAVGSVSAGNLAVQQAILRLRAVLEPVAAIPDELRALRESSRLLAEAGQAALEEDRQLLAETRQVQQTLNEALGQVTRMAEGFNDLARNHKSTLESIGSTFRSFQTVGIALSRTADQLGAQATEAAGRIGRSQEELGAALTGLREGGDSFRRVVERVENALDQRLDAFADGADRLAEAAEKVVPAAETQAAASETFRQAAEGLRASIDVIQGGSTGVAAAAQQLRDRSGELAGVLRDANQATEQLRQASARYGDTARDLAVGTGHLREELANWREHSGRLSGVATELTDGVRGHLERLDQAGFRPVAASLGQLRELLDALHKGLDVADILREFGGAVDALRDAADAQHDAARRLLPRTWAEWVFGTRRRGAPRAGRKRTGHEA